MKPTNKNLIQTISHNLKGRNQSVYNFVKMLNSQSGSISIAVDGKWGSGKTFFIKQCKLVLDCLNDKDYADNKKKP
ncbi:hypothetical protein H3R26_05245 [Lactobacillus sp. W8092]|nr:hypothetical protein [Lactobacillus sp. W8092]